MAVPVPPSIRNTTWSLPDERWHGTSAIGDSAPDRWGRVLMQRMERRRARHHGKTPATLREIDYLLLVEDETRAGAPARCDSLNGRVALSCALPMRSACPLWSRSQVARANRASIERPPEEELSSRSPRALMPNVGFLALRVPVDVAEESGKRARA